MVEFLHRVVDTITDYFNECSEAVIKDNYVVVYELLDEMLDNGFPLATESNILKELIKPPNILRTVVNTVTGKTKSVLLLIQGFCAQVFLKLFGSINIIYYSERVSYREGGRTSSPPRTNSSPLRTKIDLL